MNWVNNDNNRHFINILSNPTSGDNSILLGSKDLEPFGDSYELTFDKSGNYYYYDSSNPAMSGRIKVN